MEKVCPCCGISFTCRPDSISECQCASAHLDDTARAWLKERYTECLCISCLLEIKNELRKSQNKD